MALHIFDSVPSTNQYCELLDLSQVEEFAIYAAHEQTAGIGQRGNCWASEPGKNLTGSLILKPDFLPFADQYKLTQAVSLALTDFLLPLLPITTASVKIKWPNDIYVGQSKICGILISNRIQGEHISASIIGIGLNVNQELFPKWVPNPVSLRQLTGAEYEPDTLWADLLNAIKRRYLQLQQTWNNYQLVEEEYLARLLNWNQEAAYLYRGEIINATIRGINRFGHLLLTDSEGNCITCQMQEIKLIL